MSVALRLGLNACLTLTCRCRLTRKPANPSLMPFQRPASKRHNERGHPAFRAARASGWLLLLPNAAAYRRLAGASWLRRPLDRPADGTRRRCWSTIRATLSSGLSSICVWCGWRLALLTGAALGVAGLLLQTVIRNPLGEPHILGLNAGASLAVVATSALGLSFGAFPAGRPLTAAPAARGCCSVA